MIRRSLTNPPSFVALPVTKGDAFYLKGPSGSVLFDGGQFQGLEALLGLHASNSAPIDAVVCSHNDADHAKGLIPFLRSGNFFAKEVWLPGSWMERLPDLFTNTEAFFKELVDQIGVKPPSDQNLSIEEYTNGANGFEPPRPEKTENLSLQDIVQDDDDDDDIEASLSGSAWPMFAFRGPRLLTSAWLAAIRIRAIAAAAFHLGSRVRWFDYDAYSQARCPLGGESWLTPLNSIELAATKPHQKRNAFDYVALSVSNRRSLVFACPNPPVIFTADSPLDLWTPPHFDDVSPIVTAPHHGSESNATAYGALNSGFKSYDLVRSDAQYKKRPGNAFRGQAHAKYCTYCHGTQLRSAVSAIWRCGAWDFGNRSKCVCR